MLFNKKKTLTTRFTDQFGTIKLTDFNFDFIEKYFRKKKHQNILQIIPDHTCNDLDFNELFCFIDRTQTPVGQQYLYNKLRTIPKENTLENQEKLIQALAEQPELRIKIQLLLEKINNTSAYHITELFQEEHIPPPKWYAIIKLLAATSLLSILFIWFNPQVFFLLLTVFITNMIIHYWNKKNIMQYVAAIPMLIKLNNVAKELHQIDLLKELNPDLQKSTLLIDKIKQSMSFFRLDGALKSELEALAWFILELIKITFLLEPLLLFGVLKKLNTKRDEIESVFSFVGQVDTLISIADLRKSLDTYCLPKITNDKSLSYTNVYHPLIENCVQNSISLKEKSVLLTGSNMSGKTTFIRTIGINALTALTINTCFAEKMVMPRLKIHSAIRISDDLMNDKSYYFEEVLRIKELIDEVKNKENHLFLLDEIFKGTNTIERISAGKAVLSELNAENSFVFVSTHDIELADLLANEYHLYHFSEVIKNDNIDFDYLLKQGPLTKRNAIRILEINNYPEKLIKEALELSKKMDEIALAK